MKKLILTLTLIFSLSAAYSQDARQYQQLVRMSPTLSEGVDDKLFAPNAKVALVTVIPSILQVEEKEASESVSRILIEELKNELESIGVNVEYTVHSPIRIGFGNVKGVNKITKDLHDNKINYLVRVMYPSWAERKKSLEKDDFYISMSEYRGTTLDDNFMAYYPINSDDYNTETKAVYGKLDDIKSKLKEAGESAPKEELDLKGYIIDEPIEIKISNGIPENMSSRTLHQVDYSNKFHEYGGRQFEKIMEVFNELAEDGYVAETKSFMLEGDRSMVKLVPAFVSGLNTIKRVEKARNRSGFYQEVDVDYTQKASFYYFLIDYTTNTYYLAFSDKRRLNEPVMSNFKKAGENLAERIERLSDN